MRVEVEMVNLRHSVLKHYTDEKKVKVTTIKYKKNKIKHNKIVGKVML